MTYKLENLVELVLVNLGSLLALFAPGIADLPLAGLLLGQGDELLVDAGLDEGSRT